MNKHIHLIKFDFLVLDLSMEEYCLDESPAYEWDTLMRNFHTELKKTEHNWWPWTVLCCYYQGLARRQIQIVISELLIFNGISPIVILATDLPQNWDQCPLNLQKQIAEQYFIKLMTIMKNLLDKK